VVLCHRLLRIGPNPSTKDAKLIAFRVGEYHPRRVTLPDIGPPSTEGKETFDFCGLIDRTEVRMESVLACLLLRNRHEQQARHPIRSRPDLELVRGVAHDNPSQGLGPPSTKRDRIVSGDDDLLPNEIHVAHSARSVSQADPPTDPNANCCDRLLEGVDERDLAGGADHRRRRVDLDHRQPPASLGNRVPSRVCAFSLTRCVSICFCQVSRSTIGGVAVMLVSFDACQVTSRMRTVGPRSGPRDQGEAGKPSGRYPHDA